MKNVYNEDNSLRTLHFIKKVSIETFSQNIAKFMCNVLERENFCSVNYFRSVKKAIPILKDVFMIIILLLVQNLNKEKKINKIFYFKIKKETQYKI